MAASVRTQGLAPAEHREHLAALREARVDSFVLKLSSSGVRKAVQGSRGTPLPIGDGPSWVKVNS